MRTRSFAAAFLKDFYIGLYSKKTPLHDLRRSDNGATYTTEADIVLTDCDREPVMRDDSNNQCHGSMDSGFISLTITAAALSIAYQQCGRPDLSCGVTD